MFQLLINNKYHKQLQLQAVPYIEIDRNKSIDIYNHILNYTYAHNLLLSDTFVLLNKHEYWNEIEIYDINANTTAKNLVKQLCEVFGNKFVLKIYDNEIKYSIEYDLKCVCTITLFILYEKYSITDFIKPAIRNISNLNILLLSPLLEVINLYKNLYNPLMYDVWEDTLSTIQELEVLVNNDIKKILIDDNFQKVDLEIVTSNTIKKLQQPLLDFFADTDYLILNHTIDEVLHIVSKNNIEYDFTLVSNYLKKFTPHALVYSEKEIFVPKEFLLEKVLVYVTYKLGTVVKKIHILTIYNNTSYELINFVPVVIHKRNYKIIDPITELRFIYIKIWEIIISHKVTKKKYQQNLKKKLQQLKHYRTLINISSFKVNYTGIYVNQIISKKIKNLIDPVKNKFTFYCYEIQSSSSS